MAMALPVLSERQYIVFLAVCVAVSTYGLTMGRPVWQTGMLQFPFAETLPFPYPLTSTLLQFLGTYALMYIASLISRIFNISFSITGASQGELVEQVPMEDLGSPKPNGGRFRTPDKFNNLVRVWDKEAWLKMFPAALVIGIEAALNSFLVDTMPLEVYIFSRALILPLQVLSLRLLFGKDDSVIASKTVYFSIAFSVFVIMAAYRPGLPHPWRIIWVGIFSSAMSALWPLLARHGSQSLGALRNGKYQKVSSTDAVPNSSGQDIPTLDLLRHISFISAIVIVPAVLYSGEPGFILRNCYLIQDMRFQLYMLASAVCRAALFTSMILLVKATSPVPATSFIVLINTSQLAFFTLDKLLLSQALGFVGCLVFCRLIISDGAESSWIAKWHEAKPSRRLTSAFATILAAVLVGLSVSLLIFPKEILVDSSPQLDKDLNRDFPASLYTAMVHGNDSYFGKRLPAKTPALKSLIVSECKAADSQSRLDVSRCLEFLLSKEYSNYNVPQPVQIKPRDGRRENEEPESEGHTKSPAEVCDGPVFPYHIWMSDLPTWRVELFIKAYLYTQNLLCSKLLIWVNSDRHLEARESWLNHPRFKRFTPLIDSGHIEVKEWRLPARIPLQPKINELDKARYYEKPGSKNSNGEVHVADSVTRDVSGQEWLEFHTGKYRITSYPQAAAEAARFIILYIHGGIFLNHDMILLRDLRPLLVEDSGFSQRQGMRNQWNPSTISLPANDSVSSYLLRGGVRMGLFFQQEVLNRMLVQEFQGSPFIIFETALFDPIYAEANNIRAGKCTVPCLHDISDIFQAAPLPNEWETYEGESFGGAAYNRTLENFYRGAYAYTIHHQWDRKFERESWLDVICSAHDRFFTGERSNPYGETWSGPLITHYRLRGDENSLYDERKGRWRFGG